jgi:uncharacterized membrane protein YfcA
MAPRVVAAAAGHVAQSALNATTLAREGWPNDLALPLSGADAMRLGVVFVAGTLAAMCGVGGGSLLVPLYLVLFHLVYEAIPLSKAAVSGAALAFFLFAVLARNPVAVTRHPNRFAYDAVMVMEPATLLGTTFGVLAQRMCPQWVITVAMVATLTSLCLDLLRRASSLRSREDSAFRQSLFLSRPSERRDSPLLLAPQHGNEGSRKGYGAAGGRIAVPTNPFGPGAPSGAAGARSAAAVAVAAATAGGGGGGSTNPFEAPTKMQRVRSNSSSSTASSGGPGELGGDKLRRVSFLSDSATPPTAPAPRWLGWRCLITVGASLLVVLGGAWLGDDKLAPRQLAVACGSLTYYAVLALSSLVCVAITALNVRFLVRHQRELGDQCAVEWSAASGVHNALQCFVAGLLSALCGIGGSTIKGPLLLRMGLEPTLAKATSQFMLLSTVTSSALQFYLGGMLPPVYGQAFFCTSFSSAVIGKWLIDWYVAARGRQSLIVYLLAYYIALSALAMAFLGLIVIAGQVRQKNKMELLGFRALCSPQPDSLEALAWLVGPERGYGLGGGA